MAGSRAVNSLPNSLDVAEQIFIGEGVKMKNIKEVGQGGFFIQLKRNCGNRLEGDVLALQGDIDIRTSFVGPLCPGAEENRLLYLREIMEALDDFAEISGE